MIQKYFDEISQDTGKYCFGVSRPHSVSRTSYHPPRLLLSFVAPLLLASRSHSSCVRLCGCPPPLERGAQCE